MSSENPTNSPVIKLSRRWQRSKIRQYDCIQNVIFVSVSPKTWIWGSGLKPNLWNDQIAISWKVQTRSTRNLKCEFRSTLDFVVGSQYYQMSNSNWQRTPYWNFHPEHYFSLLWPLDTSYAYDTALLPRLREITIVIISSHFLRKIGWRTSFSSHAHAQAITDLKNNHNYSK